MSSDDNPNSHRNRRLSVSQLAAAHFSTLTTDTSPSVQPTANPSMTSAATAAAKEPHARRLSISTLGLGTGDQTSLLDAAGIRRGNSVNSDNGRARHMSVSGGESAIDDGDMLGSSAGSPNASGGSMARRMSQGARAYQSIRSAGATGGLPPIPSGPRSEGAVAVSPPPGNRMQGYNWGDTLRARAERGSISSGSKQSSTSSSSGGSDRGAGEVGGHVRSASTSIAVPQQGSVQPMQAMQPVQEMKQETKKPVGEQAKLDPTQERILRGTFLDM